MNNWLLSVKNWQVFLAFITSYIASKYLLIIPGINEWVLILLLIGCVGWYVLLGNTLYPYLPRNVTYSITWFVIDALLVILFYALALFMFNGNLQIDGILALPAFYIFFAIAHLFWFPAALLVSIENRKEATFSQYLGTAVQLFFWPIGIWFVQSRLNKLSQSLQQADQAGDR